MSPIEPVEDDGESVVSVRFVLVLTFLPRRFTALMGDLAVPAVDDGILGNNATGDAEVASIKRIQ